MDMNKTSWKNRILRLLTIFQMATLFDKHFPRRGFFDESNDVNLFTIGWTDLTKLTNLWGNKIEIKGTNKVSLLILLNFFLKSQLN